MMELGLYLRFLAALVFVVALIAGAAWLARRYSPLGAGQRAGKGRRLGVVEIAPLDARRRLVLVRRDNVEHLVLLGATGETVIETGITSGIAAEPVMPFVALVEAQKSGA